MWKRPSVTATQRAGQQAVQVAAVRPKKILMMGGTRFIGLYLARQLVEEGHDVTLYTRGKSEITTQIADDTDESYRHFSRCASRTFDTQIGQFSSLGTLLCICHLDSSPEGLLASLLTVLRWIRFRACLQLKSATSRLVPIDGGNQWFCFSWYIAHVTWIYFFQFQETCIYMIKVSLKSVKLLFKTKALVVVYMCWEVQTLIALILLETWWPLTSDFIFKFKENIFGLPWSNTKYLHSMNERYFRGELTILSAKTKTLPLTVVVHNV